MTFWRTVSSATRSDLRAVSQDVTAQDTDPASTRPDLTFAPADATAPRPDPTPPRSDPAPMADYMATMANDLPATGNDRGSTPDAASPAARLARHPPQWATHHLRTCASTVDLLPAGMRSAHRPLTRNRNERAGNGKSTKSTRNAAPVR